MKRHRHQRAQDLAAKQIPGACLALLLALSAPSIAQAQPAVLTTADLGLDTSYTDNFFRQDAPEQRAFGVHLLPNFGIAAESRQMNSHLGLEGEYARFSIDGAPNSEDSFFDILANGRLGWQPMRRHGFAIDLLHERKHDPFGTERTEDIDDLIANRELDRWMRHRGLLTYTFGARSATVNVAVRGGEVRKRYLNNRNVTAFLDHRVTTIGSTLFYNVSPRTVLLFDAEGNRIRFDEDFPGPALQRDADELRLNAGVQWRATRKTRGDMRVGYLVRDFDDPNRSNFDAVDWQASVSWVPIARTSLTLTSGRNATESFRSETRFLDDRFIGLAWRHDWTGRTSSLLSARYSDIDFVDSAREDDFIHLRGRVSHRLTRRLGVHSTLDFRDRDSTEDPRNFSKFDVRLGLNYSL